MADIAPQTTGFIDAETNYVNPLEDNRTIRAIAMDQLRVIVKNASMEMRGGYWKQVVGMNGATVEVYVEDTREIFCNSVRALYHLCKMEAIKRKKAGDAAKMFELCIQKMDKVREDVLKKTKVQEAEILTLEFYKDPLDRQVIDQYKQHKVVLYEELLDALMIFMARIDYFQRGTFDDRELIVS